MSETTRTPNRSPDEITESAVEMALNQLARIPHYRFVAEPEEKSHIVASLRAAVDQVEHRIKTPREEFSLSAAMAQPIYASSIGRWRRHESRLAPLIEALGVSAVD